MADAALDAEILAIGRDLAKAFPPPSRNPLKVIDDKAMDFASQDAEPGGSGGEVAAVEPWGAEHPVGALRPAADGHARALEQRRA